MAAVALPTTETVSNNERLFIHYAQVFRQIKPDVPEYVNRATRFANWLKDSKAYYDLARPYVCLSFLRVMELRLTFLLPDRQVIAGIFFSCASLTCNAYIYDFSLLKCPFGKPWALAMNLQCLSRLLTIATIPTFLPWLKPTLI